MPNPTPLAFPTKPLNMAALELCMLRDALEERPTTKYFRELLLEEFLKGKYKSPEEFKLIAHGILSSSTTDRPSFSSYLETLAQKKASTAERLVGNGKQLTSDYLGSRSVKAGIEHYHTKSIPPWWKMPRKFTLQGP